MYNINFINSIETKEVNNDIQMQANEILGKYAEQIEDIKKEVALTKLLKRVMSFKEEKIKRFDMKIKDGKIKELIEDYFCGENILERCTLTIEY